MQLSTLMNERQNMTPGPSKTMSQYIFIYFCIFFWNIEKAFKYLISMVGL